jgi:predicted nucleic acid-binding protein
VLNGRVYIETSIISYLTARPSRDLIGAARQEITYEWWTRRRGQFELYTSQLVIEEASQGDAESAERRLAAIEGVPLLALSDGVAHMARALVEKGPLPERAADDAIHLAAAAIHGMDFLLTWNCRHLANAEMTEAIVGVIAQQGFVSPVVCTPEELMGESYV